jgi:hypothetical protein
MRVDRAVGRSTAFFGNFMSRSSKLKAEDFSPYDAEPKQEQSIEEVFSVMKGLARKN